MLGLLGFYSGFSVFLLFFFFFNDNQHENFPQVCRGLRVLQLGVDLPKETGLVSCVKLFIFALKLLFQSLFNLKFIIIDFEYSSF